MPCEHRTLAANSLRYLLIGQEGIFPRALYSMVIAAAVVVVPRSGSRSPFKWKIAGAIRQAVSAPTRAALSQKNGSLTK